MATGLMLNYNMHRRLMVPLQKLPDGQHSGAIRLSFTVLWQRQRCPCAQVGKMP